MKKGWEICSIGEVCDLLTGGTPSKTKPEYFGGSIKWLVSGDIHQGEIFDCEGRITEAGLQNSNARYLPVDSVLIALAGQGKTRGTVALLRTKATCNQSLICITPKDRQRLLPEFIYVNLHGRYEEIRRMTGDSGDDRRGLNMRLISRIQIPIPLLPEQRRIVAILDEAFEGITAAKANAEKNLRNANEILESRLQSLLSPDQAGCNHYTLDEIASVFGRGKSRHRPRNEPTLYGGPYPFIQTGDIRSADHVVTTFTQTYSDKGLAQSKLWPRGTVCITIAANIAESAILGFDACFPDSVVGVIPNPQKASAEFLEFLLQAFKRKLQAMGKGSAQDNINVGTFENQRFPFPSLEEQRKEVAILSSVLSYSRLVADCVNKKIEALDELKASLLHQAFTGQL